MAIKLKDYYLHYRVTVAAQLIATQLGVALITFGSGWLIREYIYLPPDAEFLFVGAIFVLLEIIAIPLMIKLISEPIAVITQALAHVSKQGGKTPPPNVNARKHETSGLRTVVQSIYELAVSNPQEEVEATEGEKVPTLVSQQMLQSMVNNLPCGLVALHADHSIAFHNSLAPIKEGVGGKPELHLLFENSDNLESWLKDCEANKVKDTKIWRRISDQLPDTENQRIFDVIGYYNKGNDQGVETVLIMVDRTTDYAPDQEDMDFIALAAHELRGPITVIRGYLDVLNEELAPVLKNDQHELIERLSVSANRLSGYINNILNVSRYDRKHLKLHLQEEDIMDIMQSLVDDLEMRARTQNRLLGFEIPEKLPAIAADRNSLTEVISNLVDNAIKYSNEGGQIIVKAGVKGNFVEVTVEDFGIGMPTSVVGNLFSKFYRSHRSRQSIGGTGLGLYISKAIVESHGGSIWVKSVESQGSVFGFTVPIYATVADKLKSSNNGNEGIIENASGWIRNHSMYRRN